MFNTTDQSKFQRVKTNLAVFSDADVDDIISIVMSRGRELRLSPSIRETESLPPAIFGFLRHITAARDAAVHSDIMWGLITIFYNGLKASHGLNYYEGLLTSAFNLSPEYASQIAARINTTDKIDNWMDSILDYGRRFINYPLPDALEIPEKNSNDLDALWETMLLGREVKALSMRASMALGTLVALTSSSMVLGSVGKTTAAETNDPEYADAIGREFGDLVLHSQIGDIYDSPELGGPFRRMANLSKTVLARIPKQDAQRFSNMAVTAINSQKAGSKGMKSFSFRNKPKAAALPPPPPPQPENDFELESAEVDNEEMSEEGVEYGDLYQEIE